MKNVKIIVAAHKIAPMPKDDSLYVPIHVGAINKEDLGYIRDDSGDNISHMNPYYSELTGLYWANKNLEADYIGLVHYRRYFTNKPERYREGLMMDEVILSYEKVNELLEKTDVLVPKKQRYYIETLYSHYAHTFKAEHLDKTREIIKRLSPDYLNAFDKVMKQRSAYMFNMYIMKKELSQEYCNWLFAILDALYKEIDITTYTSFEARMFGRVSELLFNVWLERKNISVVEVPYIYTEKINWPKKIMAFLQAKFIGKKYDKSF